MAHAADSVLHHHPAFSEGSIVCHIFRWALFVLPTCSVLVTATRLAPGGSSQPLWVQLVYPHIGQVSFPSYSIGKALHQLRLREQRDVSSGSPHALPHVTQQAGVQVHSHLTLDGVPLLLARVPLVSFTPTLSISRVWSLRTLYPLLEGVNHHRKIGQLREELVKASAVFTARVRHLHAILTSFSQYRQSAPQQPRHGRVGDPKEETEHLIRGVEAG